MPISLRGSVPRILAICNSSESTTDSHQYHYRSEMLGNYNSVNMFEPVVLQVIIPNGMVTCDLEAHANRNPGQSGPVMQKRKGSPKRKFSGQISRRRPRGHSCRRPGPEISVSPSWNGVWGRGCDEAEISEEKRLCTEWGQGIQWMRALLRISTGKVIQWRGWGHSVNSSPSKISAPTLSCDRSFAVKSRETLRLEPATMIATGELEQKPPFRVRNWDRGDQNVPNARGGGRLASKAAPRKLRLSTFKLRTSSASKRVNFRCAWKIRTFAPSTFRNT